MSMIDLQKLVGLLGEDLFFLSSPQISHVYTGWLQNFTHLIFSIRLGHFGKRLRTAVLTGFSKIENFELS